MSIKFKPISGKNIEQLVPFAKDAEAMLCAKFKYSPARAKKLVEQVILHFFRKEDANFKNPRRALLHTCRGWAAKGGMRNDH
jgi:hypothetical protein